MSSSKNISSSSEDDIEIRRGPWTLDEDELLIKYVANHGEGRWNMLAKHAGLKRTGKSCRLRWLNYLKPDVKRGNLSPQEQLIIFELHSKWGNRWSKIAQRLPGRTDNEIKNYWRTRVQKQAKHLKIDSDSIEFQKFIKLLWIPQLLQKDKGSFSSSLVLDQNQNMPLPSNQYSESATPTQITLQGHCSPCMYETVLNTDQHDPHSDLKHNTSSYISAESISTASPMSGYPNSQLQIMCNSESSTFPNSYCYKHNDVYSLDTFNLDITTSAAEGFQFPVGDCQVTESNWIDKDFSEYLQNMELWQI